jgi:hypothetical protein
VFRSIAPAAYAAPGPRRLVDEYALFVHPGALGADVPFFRGRVDLRLLTFASSRTAFWSSATLLANSRIAI